MSTEQTTDTTVTDNLDDFAAEFFGENTEPSGNAKPEEDTVEETESGAPTETEQDTHSAEEGATEETEDTEDSEEEPTDEDDNEPKGKKNRLQERINELTAARRQAERERDEALKKLEEKDNPPKSEPNKDQASPTELKAPSASDKNEDGTDKYPLGEFDPAFVRDTVEHLLEQKRIQEQEEAQERQKLSAEEQYRASLQDNWNQRLDIVQERYPDFQEKGEQMLSVFEGIDPAYGQYLTDTLMEMDAGPEVFYYLANNIEEAQEIVNAGPRKATIALGRLETKLAGTQTPETPKVKVTKAPTPPPQVKGSAVSKASIPLDTDDLDAFSKVMFSKK